MYSGACRKRLAVWKFITYRVKFRHKIGKVDENLAFFIPVDKIVGGLFFGRDFNISENVKYAVYRIRKMSLFIYSFEQNLRTVYVLFCPLVIVATPSDGVEIKAFRMSACKTKH